MFANEVFGFLNPHSLLRSDSIEVDMDKFEKMYADDVNFTELRLEISRFNRLLQYNPVVLHLKMTLQRWTCCSG